MFYSSGMFEPRAPNAERIKSGRGDARLALASCVWYNSLQSETKGGLFTEKRSFFFDLYGTLVDVRTDEKMPSLWRGMARYCSLGGAAYAPSELRTRYLALCAQETAALVQKSGLPEREVEIELRRVFRRLYAEKGVRVSAARLNDTAIAFRALSYTRTPRLIPGARRTLDELRRRGAKLFLLSNAQSCFTVPELRLLVDSVQSSRFITRRKSMELIEKIEKLASVHQAKGLRRQVWVKNRIKSMNESIYYHYFRFDPQRKRQLRHGGAWYQVSPYALLWDSENYYLVAYDSDAGIIKHFRVDKIMDLQRTGKPRDGREVFAGVDMSVYANAHFGMFSGGTEQVRLEFDNSLAGAVIDRFGESVILVPGEEGRFTVTVPTAVTPPFFAWLCTFGDQVRVLAPESAVDAMRQHIAKIAACYADEELIK